MMMTIQLHYKIFTQTSEICDILPYDMLPTKLRSLKSLPTKNIP